MNTAAAELTIDRGPEFDQSRMHIHEAGTSCWCGVSHDIAIAEIKAAAGIQDSDDTGDPSKAAADYSDRLAVAHERIQAFERLTDALANHIDKINAEFEFVTGKGVQQWLDEQSAEAPQIPEEYCRCGHLRTVHQRTGILHASGCTECSCTVFERYRHAA